MAAPMTGARYFVNPDGNIRQAFHAFDVIALRQAGYDGPMSFDDAWDAATVNVNTPQNTTPVPSRTIMRIVTGGRVDGSYRASPVDMAIAVSIAIRGRRARHS
jgi:hypothetical protein